MQRIAIRKVTNTREFSQNHSSHSGSVQNKYRQKIQIFNGLSFITASCCDENQLNTPNKPSKVIKLNQYQNSCNKSQENTQFSNVSKEKMKQKSIRKRKIEESGENDDKLSEIVNKQIIRIMDGTIKHLNMKTQILQRRVADLNCTNQMIKVQLCVKLQQKEHIIQKQLQKINILTQQNIHQGNQIIELKKCINCIRFCNRKQEQLITWQSNTTHNFINQQLSEEIQCLKHQNQILQQQILYVKSSNTSRNQTSVPALVFSDLTHRFDKYKQCQQPQSQPQPQINQIINNILQITMQHEQMKAQIQQKNIKLNRYAENIRAIEQRINKFDGLKTKETSTEQYPIIIKDISQILNTIA